MLRKLTSAFAAIGILGTWGFMAYAGLPPELPWFTMFCVLPFFTFVALIPFLIAAFVFEYPSDDDD